MQSSLIKKTFLAFLIATTLGICGWLGWLMVPRAIATYYIRQVERNYDQPTEHAAYDRLIQLGRCAVPTLLENAIEDRFDDDLARARGCAPTYHSRDWLDELMYARRMNPKPYRRDACALALANAWQTGWLSRANMERLLLVYERHCLWAPRTVAVGSSTIRINIDHHRRFQEGRGIDGELWVKRRTKWFVDDCEVEVHTVGRSLGNRSQWLNYPQVQTRQGPVSIFHGIMEEHADVGLELPNSELGSHTIRAVVQLGPGTAGERGLTDDPPPWQVECTLGPLQFEVVQDITIEARSDPVLDSSIRNLLDQWQPNVGPDRRTSKLVVQYPFVQMNFPIPLTGDFKVLVDGKDRGKRRYVDASKLELPSIAIHDLKAGLHIVQLQFTPSEEEARISSKFDEYWGGQYTSGVTEFELGPDRDVLQVRTVARESD